MSSGSKRKPTKNAETPPLKKAAIRGYWWFSKAATALMAKYSVRGAGQPPFVLHFFEEPKEFRSGKGAVTPSL